jgi:protein-L-isoaspartate(D-aspartate) O-methyltransferase
MTGVAPQQALWQAMLAGGVLQNPSDRLRDAFFATPRHEFVDRYRTQANPAWRTGPIEEIYSDVALVLVGEDGAAQSTCSMPGYILSLVDWLDVQPGHKVLEVGSGCGWLVAIMAELAKPHGQVWGIEIDQDLVNFSRYRLRGRGVGISQGDGTAGYARLAPYDRIIYTAGADSVPQGLVEQLKPSGRLLIPVRVQGGEHHNQMTVQLFEKSGETLELLGERPGYFVPLRS